MTRSTAILVIGFSRPDLIKKRISELQIENDIPIIVSVDGGIESQQKLPQWQELCVLFPNVIWQFQPVNLGLARHVYEAISRILKRFDNCFVIEDDVSVQISSLREALRFLEVRLPEDVMTVGLFGALPCVWPMNYFCVNRFRKTRYFSAWAWGIQKEDWSGFNLEIVQSHKATLMDTLSTTLGSRKASIWPGRLKKVIDKPYSTWDFQLFFYSLKLGKSHYLPVFRSCENEGFGDARATNTKEPKPSWYLGNSIAIEFIDKKPLDDGFRQKLLEQLDSATWVSDNVTIQKMRKYKNHGMKQ